MILASVLLCSIFIAFAVPGIVVAVRALPWVARKVEAGVKPWVCDICSCFWVTLMVTAALSAMSLDPWYLLAAGPGYTGALAVLRFVQAPAMPPPPEE